MEDPYPITNGEPPEYWSCAPRCQLSSAEKVYFGLFPRSCIFCNAPSSTPLDCCRRCWTDLPWNLTACRVCAVPMALEDRICGGCLKRPPAFGRTWAPLRYAFPLAHLIRDLKFHARLPAAKTLARLIAGTRPPDVDALIAVPLHPTRLRGRGYNQAEQLALQVGKRWGLPVRAGILKRVSPTAPQVGMKLDARRSNVRDAFQCKGPPPLRVGLVDDVMTTGSTVNECARVLIRAGAESVIVIAAARAEAVT